MFQQLTLIQMAMVAVGLAALGIITVEGVLISRRRGGEPYDLGRFLDDGAHQPVARGGRVPADGRRAGGGLAVWRVDVCASPVDGAHGHRLGLGGDVLLHGVFLLLAAPHRSPGALVLGFAPGAPHGQPVQPGGGLPPVAHRQGPGGFVFFAPQRLLGFSPDAVLLSYIVNLVYQFWTTPT